MASLRLFFAVPVAAAAVPSLEALHARLQRHDGWRWSDKSSWHITTAFLGDTDSGALPLLERLGEYTTTLGARGDIRLTRLEWWPTQLHPRLLVATGAATEPLLTLHRTLRDQLAQQGFNCDARPLRPHLTLARLQRSAERPALPACAEQVPVTTMALYLSERKVRRGKDENGSEYRIIREWPLAG